MVKKFGYVIFCAALGCQTFRESPSISVEASPVVSTMDSTLIRDGLMSRASVKQFYFNRGFSLFWHLGSHTSRSADSLLYFIRNAHNSGLIPEDYHLDEYQKLAGDTLAPDRLPRMDVLLTDAYLTLYSHIKEGRLEPVSLQRIDRSSFVNQAAITSLRNIHGSSVLGNLAKLEPEFEQFRELKKALKSFNLLGTEDTTQRNRAVKIALNMERWRWQHALPERYVAVNIPAYTLRAVERDSLWLETRVIVGKRETPTPVMESVIRSFIIYPYWHVPFSISTKEILPALQRDASYLRRNNFDVLDKSGRVILTDTIQWDGYTREYFPFILRQREGSENSMGIIKFNFANNYGVYLHDTNSKRLFERTKRDLSHGCVRVKNAVSFAHYLVREDDIYVSPEDLDQYLSLQQRLKIDLRKPIALKLEYFTAEIKDGVALFYADIYKKDSVMLRALNRPAAPQAAPPLNSSANL